MTNSSVLEWMWKELKKDIDAVNAKVDSITRLSQRAETGGGFQSFAYADRPLAATGGMQTDNTQYADMGFCYDARKSGEGVGVGTGVPCYYDPAIDDWRRFEDNAIVSN